MKKLLSVLLMGTMLLSIPGCASSEKVTEKSTEQPTAATVTPSKEPTLDKSQELIIYTNSGSDGRDTWLIQKAEEAGYKIQVVSLGASEVTNRLIAEKNNPVADVVIGQNNIEYEKLKAEDLLLPWKPTWVDGVDSALVDPQGFFYPISTTPLVLIYNNEMKTPPVYRTDLVKPEYKDLYQLHSLSGGTGKIVYASILSRFKDEKGELGISPEGWAVAKEYFGNSHLIAKGEDSIGAIIDGTLPMDMHWASGVISEEKTRQYKFGMMTPEVGEPFVVESVAVVKTTTKPELSVDFLNWFGSSEFQLAWSNEWGTIPAQKDALASVDPAIKEIMQKFKPQQLDWAFIAANIDAWVEKAELEFVK